MLCKLCCSNKLLPKTFRAHHYNRIEEMNGQTYVIKNNKIVYTIDFGNGQAYGTITDQNNNTLFDSVEIYLDP